MDDWHKCSGLYHSIGTFETIRYRCPSSVFFGNRFRSADCQKIQLSNFFMIATGNHNFERFAALCNTLGGSQGAENLRFYHSTNRSVPSASGGFCPHLRVCGISLRKLASRVFKIASFLAMERGMVKLEAATEKISRRNFTSS